MVLPAVEPLYSASMFGSSAQLWREPPPTHNQGAYEQRRGGRQRESDTAPEIFVGGVHDRILANAGKSVIL